MTMNCAAWEEKLNAHRDGELADADWPALETHLASCADCRRTRDALQAQSQELDALRFDSRTLEACIIAAVHAEPTARRRPLPWILLAAAAAAVVAIALVLRPPQERHVPTTTGMELRAATGPVDAWVGKDWSPIASCDGMRPGIRIRTGDASKCEIVCRDGSFLRLDASTEIRIDGPRAVHLRSGEIYAQITPTGAPFRFSTEDGRLEADAGALDLSYRRSKEPPPAFVTSLTVVVGQVRVADREVSFPAACTVRNQTPVEPVVTDPVLQTRWTHDLLKLRGKEDPEVDLRVRNLLVRSGELSTPELYDLELRGFGDRACPGLLTILTRTGDPWPSDVRRRAARFLADLAGPEEVGALIGLARDTDPSVADAAMLGLRRVTQESCKGAAAWEAWYRQNKEGWACPKDRKK